MPRTLIIRSFLSLCCVFIFGAFVSVTEVQEEPLATRVPASLDVHHSQLLQVAIRSPKGISRHEDQDTVLLGYMRVDKQVPGDLRYKWDLPDGVSIVNGRKQGYIRNLRAGQINEIQLVVRGFSQDELKVISLYGYIVNEDDVQGRSASLTSRPHDSYEILNPKRIKAE